MGGIKINIKYKQIEKKFFVDKKDKTTSLYLAECSALSFHKSIIGLTELAALEKLKDHPVAGGYRISRAINTYYIIFHLFCSLMLLDLNYDIELKKKKCQGDFIDLKVSGKELGTLCELPDTWNKCGELEQDFSTLITHHHIKSYCALKRESKVTLAGPFKILYDNFIYTDMLNPNSSIKGLYEKVCYVRDRMIYRPSIVIGLEGERYQTSLYVRNEIENLPKANELFNIISQIYYLIEKDCNIDVNHLYWPFIFYLWDSNLSDDQRDILATYGFNNNEIENIRIPALHKEDKVLLSSYLTHYVEIANKERILADLEKYWLKLNKNFKKVFNERINRITIPTKE